MTVSLKTLLDRSERNIGDAHEVVKDTALEVIRRAYKEGILVQISEGYRSNARQQELYNQGRTTSGNVVTNARPGTSYHNYGLAVDYFLVSNDGTEALWNVNSDWRRVAAIGKELGFEWGGDWKGFVDYPHLQMSGGLSISQLQAGKRPTLISKVSGSTSKPSAKKDYIENGDSGSEVTKLQKRLVELGYKLPKYGVDGDFGDETESAVKAFQKDHKIAVDGIVGPVTQRHLHVAAEPSNGIPVKGRIKIVNVRNAAYICDSPSSTESRNLSIIGKGKEIDIAGSIPRWWEVIYDGKRAYVNEKYGKRIK